MGSALSPSDVMLEQYGRHLACGPAPCVNWIANFEWVVYFRGLCLKWKHACVISIPFHANRSSSLVAHWALKYLKNATFTVKACVTLKHPHLQKFYFHPCLCIRNKLQAEIFSRGWRIVEQMQQHIFQLMHLQNVNSFCWLMQFSCRIMPLFGAFIYLLSVN